MDESQKHVEPKKPDVKEYAFLYIKYKTGKTNLCFVVINGQQFKEKKYSACTLNSPWQTEG